MLRCGAFMYNSVSRKQNQNTKWIHSIGKMWNVYRKQYWLKRKKSKESDCRLDCIHPALLYFIYSMGRIFLLLLLRLPLMKYGKAIGFFKIDTFISVQSLSHIRLFVTPWTAACQASLSITNSWSLLKLMSIGLVMPSNHLILCHPLLLLPSIFPSIRVFSNE